jgi:CheY-like chemotaxis protein
MDVQMPEMDGLEATRQIRRRQPGEQGPRIIAMTANVTKDDRQVCLDAGMNDYLPKPIRVEELAAALNRSQPVNSQRRLNEDEDLARIAPREDRPSADGPTEIVDLSALDTLRRVAGGDQSAFSELIQSFLGETPSLLTELRVALGTGDTQVFWRAGHTLKSSSRDFGALRLSELGRQMEALGKAGRLEGATELVLQAEAEFDRVKETLNKIAAGG